MSNHTSMRRRAIATTSWIAIGVAVACAGTAVAQTTTSAPAGETAVSDVIVVGARASQQSAIDRKKRASTATDSIVADDVGSFPDRNLNEALSRVAGVAIDRNEYGEGQSVAIRGNGPDFTRVELDGIGVQATGGSLAISGVGIAATNGGRGADLRELPADLIKSVDVIKGSTADMTEGSLGGSVKITTRSGLDFKKPYFSVRLGAQQNELGEKVTPDINMVASRKFLDNRLGAIVSYTQSNIQLNQNQSQVVTSGNAGYSRAADFDLSPEKTFVYNVEAIQGVDRNVVFGNGSTETPLTLVTKSRDAQTKADCLLAFPNIVDNAATQAVKNQRASEQSTCLNQWNDYTPSLNRLFINSQEEKRVSADIRLDYQVTDHFKVYAKYAIANRNHQQENASLNPGSIGFNGAPADTFTNSLADGVAHPANSINTRTAIVPANPLSQVFYVIDSAFPAGSTIARDINTTTTVTNAFFPNYGTTVNVDPSTVVVDANHHVTEYVLTNGVYSIGQNSHFIDVESSYMQFGGEYWKGPLRVEFVANRSESYYSRDQFDTGRGSSLGRTKFKVNSSGIFEAELPTNFDDFNGANFVQALTNLTGQPGAQTAAAATATAPALTGYTAAQRAQYYGAINVQMNPGIEEGEETAAKLDVTYDLRNQTPFFTQFKTGYSYRNAIKDAWGRGGRTVRPRSGTFGVSTGPNAFDPGVYVPTMALRGTARACLPSAGSVLPGGEPCPYGYIPNVDPSNRLYGTETFTPDALIALVEKYTKPAGATFFDGYPGSTNTFSFSILDAHGLFSNFAQYANMNLDCVKRCMANDGLIYDQPFAHADEVFHAAYYRLDFEQSLPFGMEFDGNVGLRVVRTEREASGVATFVSIRKTAAFNPALPNLTAGITTTSVSTPTSVSGSRTDVLPSYNVNLWVIPDQVVVRGYTAKTVTQPNISRLLPNGSCTVDERIDDLDNLDADDLDQACATMGNPNLQPHQARDMNIAVEWYPNRDTSISLAWHKLDVKVGGAILARVENQKLFAGSDAVDTATGRPIADEEFAYNTYVNAPGGQTTGLEFQAKTAFTFLPWFLRYTGADFNYSKLTSSSSLAGYRDPLTNESLPPQGQAAFYQNLSVWYDDGRFQARVSYQARGETFNNITGASGNQVNNPPVGNPSEVVRTPYNPGEPYYSTETKFIDAKLSYKPRPNIEVFLEGRNLGKFANTTVGSTAAGRGFADGTPTAYQIGYGGRRVMFGITYRYGN